MEDHKKDDTKEAKKISSNTKIKNQNEYNLEGGQKGNVHHTNKEQKASNKIPQKYNTKSNDKNNNKKNEVKGNVGISGVFIKQPSQCAKQSTGNANKVHLKDSPTHQKDVLVKKALNNETQPAGYAKPLSNNGNVNQIATKKEAQPEYENLEILFI
ncbi:Hypothetical protein SRAE_2000054000 [Strongyloides ratti]|uniref:Uncharacterized protein n=1 Tax=Strongyloides ratti TaxID=34506 RepID=A0A090LED1_STRRB|nr:Hypothetical protein SRAE_2000054000 [Strongyloides ratti]CEF65865.1 Hypothetical protein SRAE_2000054000 [Strongyloides ratti]